MQLRLIGPTVAGCLALLPLFAPSTGCAAGASSFSPPSVGVDAGGAPQPVYHAVVTQSVPPPPISGGTLVVSRDGAHAFAADSDRDAVYVVDLKNAVSVSVPLTAGDEPGRVVEDAAGHVHVVLRSAGAIVAIDPVAKSVLGRTPVCARPRGIAYMAASDALYVACAGGELVTLPASGGAATRTVFVEPDLRDIVVVGSNVYVSELRSAAILQIAADGSIANRFLRPSAGLELGVAWRMIATPQGLAVSLQGASSTPIGTMPGSYGTGGCGGAVTNPMVATWSLGGAATGLSTLQGVLPVDVAASPDGQMFAIVAAGEWLVPNAGQLVLTPSVFAPSGDDGGAELPPSSCSSNAIPVAGQAISVAYDPSGRLLVQTREPARLIIDADQGYAVTVPLSAVSRDDTGHEVFHSDQGGGIACASCHVEGGDDGRTWTFVDVGPRRTPSVLGTVQGTAPYHWDGSQLDLPMLYKGSLARMSGADLSDDQTTAFTSWLDALPGPASVAGDPAAIARGQALFQGAGGCASCHSGPRFTNNQTVDVGTGEAFQVPPLVGVSARAPFLHDGCAPTLIGAIGACGHASTHGATADFSSAQLSDLATYLETL